MARVHAGDSRGYRSTRTCHHVGGNPQNPPSTHRETWLGSSYPERRKVVVTHRLDDPPGSTDPRQRVPQEKGARSSEAGILQAEVPAVVANHCLGYYMPPCRWHTRRALGCNGACLRG